jgi:ribosomal protein L40E
MNMMALPLSFGVSGILLALLVILCAVVIGAVAVLAWIIVAIVGGLGRLLGILPPKRTATQPSGGRMSSQPAGAGYAGGQFAPAHRPPPLAGVSPSNGRNASVGAITRDEQGNPLQVCPNPRCKATQTARARFCRRCGRKMLGAGVEMERRMAV